MSVEAQKETLGFQAEVKQLLKLMINSLYSNKEIFLRELISNASDAADKLRYKALSDDKIYNGDADLAIRVTFDKTARTVTISDNGIGMTRDEVIANLGTIAKSGTREFLDNLTGDKAKDTQLIGQFGVGFYSAFIVADKVTVLTRSALSNEGVQWTSAGEGEYTIETVEKANRGTDIICHLRADEDEFLDSYRLKNIIRKYSDHISLPVQMLKDVTPSAEDEKNKDETVIEVPEFETVNDARALWTLPKSEIKDDEYKTFYKYVSHDFEEPLTWSHNRVEGKLEYTSLLYIPKRAPFDLWNRERNYGLKLYVQRVFIMDDADQFLPSYLRFIRGVVDTNDLPLNISREILQGNRMVDNVRGALVKRVLDMLEKLAKDEPENYATVWKEFGKVIKEGPAEDFANRERIAKLLRFNSTKSSNEAENVSLEDYVSRMRDKQEKIYYITADSLKAAGSSPHLEVYRKQDIEVLLLHDHVDEWLVSHLTEFDGKPLHSISKGDLDIGELPEEEKKEQEAVEKNMSPLVERIKKVLGEKVKDVRITHRLTDSPACLVADSDDMGRQLQKMLEAAGQSIPNAKPIFEVNPTHRFIEKINHEQDEDRFATFVSVIFDQAMLAEGSKLEDPANYVKQINQLLLDLS